MNDPARVALDPSGNLWVADTGNNRVLRFPKGPDGFASGQAADVVLGQPDFTSSGPETGATSMNSPTGVSVDPSGNVWVADMTNSRVLQFVAWQWPPSSSPSSPPSG